MHTYAKQFDTADFAILYTRKLLRRFASLLDYTVEPQWRRSHHDHTPWWFMGNMTTLSDWESRAIDALRGI